MANVNNDMEVRMATTLVQTTIEQWETRLTELQPMIDEANELRAAMEALGHKAPTRRRGNTRGRRRNGGRRQEFLELVKDQPGITVTDAAKRMKIHPNYLYRLAGEAVKDGTAQKEGKGYRLKDAPAEAEVDNGGQGNGGADE